MKTIKLTDEELELLISDTEAHLEMVNQYRKSKDMTGAEISIVDKMRFDILDKLKHEQHDRQD